ncbi:hypothetical protein FA95DRAFT_478131 [Auriscalpium vulgare]|uniref:Uncharacterized protein n=1 Tax=Auriscalpium vulgare TaxID=40419 RepID=A0ACB8SBL1_9AGAM|nr:hypothetical protein FA95DRAFT_478131 [Auriscalpium vulgare]
MSDHDPPPEQDEHGGDGLPTYDDVADRQGPNSRFGRWRSWIEKRAAERYADMSPEEFNRRRERGWDISDDSQQSMPEFTMDEPTTPTTSKPSLFSINTQWKDLPSPPAEPEESPALDSEQPLVLQSLAPAHLSLSHFGSRFLPHTTSPIRTLLPILGDSMLLVGHDDGLSVINMFPKEWNEFGLRSKGPGEAEAHRIWTGEGVYQMSILEVENVGETTPQGVVLLLVGTETDSQENHRTMRMYNLTSLISLAKWAVSQKGARPLDMRRPARWHPQQSPSRKHKSSGSLAKGLKSLMISDTPAPPEASASYHSMMPSLAVPHDPRNTGPSRKMSTDSWEVIEDLPLRWATDFVPLAPAGSRLVNTSVLSYDVWRDEVSPRGGALLAVATKTGVFLYESPKGERAFRLVKDFYTPLQPRNIMFVQQSLSDAPVLRNPSEPASSLAHVPSLSYGVRLSPATSPSASRARRISFTPQSVMHGPQLSLFVMFDKKAGLIRVSDSAVGEVELYDEAREALSPMGSLNSTHKRRSRASFDGHASAAKGIWTLPAKLDLPSSSGPSDIGQVYLLTRGRQTRIVPCPLPANLQSTPPLQTFNWRSHPTHVSPRFIPSRSADGKPCLQLIAFGEDGLEVQESSLSLASNGKDKGRMEEPVYAYTDAGGVAMGFLLGGGHWHRPFNAPLTRSQSSRSGVSLSSLDTEDLAERLHAHQGLYGWQQRGFDDWRVFWVGGLGDEQSAGG